MSSKIKKCQKIDKLIRKKATGTPKQLAKMIGASETYTKRLIAFMRHEYKIGIRYSVARGYTYINRGKFFVGWIDEE